MHFTDEELFTQKELQEVTDLDFKHPEELVSYTAENMSETMSHFQLVVLVRVLLFTPVDFYISIQKGHGN